MSTFALSIYIGGFLQQSGRGFAQETKDVEQKYITSLKEFKKAETIGRDSELLQALTELKEMYDDCSQDNWDGYGAKAVIENTYLEATKIIKLLQSSFLNVPMPELIPEPDGDIAFEWNDNDGRTFVFSVDDDGTLTFAGIFNPGKPYGNVHGSEKLTDFIPNTIINHLKRLYFK